MLMFTGGYKTAIFSRSEAGRLWAMNREYTACPGVVGSNPDSATAFLYTALSNKPHGANQVEEALCEQISNHLTLQNHNQSYSNS